MSILDSIKTFARIATLLLALMAAAHAQDAGEGGADGGGGTSSGDGGGDHGNGADDDGPDGDPDGETADAPSEGFSASPRSDNEHSKGETLPGSLNRYIDGPDGALAAVQARRSLPLESIVTAARHLTEGQIIDARLKAVNGTLQYELKVLEETGQVRRYSFDARTGGMAKVR